MLVTINPKYKGVYGHYVEKLGTVQAKRAGCEPFDEDPMIAKRQIEKGVMVAVDTAAAPFEPETVIDMPEPKEPIMNDEPDYESMSFAELKAAAKKVGMTVTKGTKKETIIAKLRESEAPSFDAIDPI